MNRHAWALPRHGPQALAKAGGTSTLRQKRKPHPTLALWPPTQDDSSVGRLIAASRSP